MIVKKLNNVGVEISGIDIRYLSDEDYAIIRKILVEELIVVIKRQYYEDAYPFAKLTARMGAIGNIDACRWIYPDGNFSNPQLYVGNKSQPENWAGNHNLYPVQRVTGNVNKQGVSTGIFGTGTLTWHSNLNHPRNAAGVSLQAIQHIEGTSTSFLDTTKIYEDMSDEWKMRCMGIVGNFKYTPDIWAEGLPLDQRKVMLDVHVKLFGSLDYKMPLLNKNLSGSKTGLFFHFMNSCTFPEDPELLEDLKKLCFQEKYIYQHWWEPGDIVLMEQRLTLHKRDQDDPEILKDRLLHRFTFMFQ